MIDSKMFKMYDIFGFYKNEEISGLAFWWATGELLLPG